MNLKKIRKYTSSCVEIINVIRQMENYNSKKKKYIKKKFFGGIGTVKCVFISYRHFVFCTIYKAKITYWIWVTKETFNISSSFNELQNDNFFFSKYKIFSLKFFAIFFSMIPFCIYFDSSSVFCSILS